jgi:hydroxymethylbilane synthase
LDPELMLPAPAQGALAVECRADDADLVEMLAALDHAPSRSAVTAERAMLATLEAGCSAPVAAYASVPEGGHEIYLRGAVISPDGARAVRASRTGTPADAAEIGKALAADLLDAGADTLMGSRE